jgi:hypothetical protein
MPQKPMGLWDLKVPTFSRQLAQKWQPYMLASFLLTPRNILGTHFRWQLSWPQDHRAARIRPIEKFSSLIGIWTCNHPACSKVSQPITHVSAPFLPSQSCLSTGAWNMQITLESIITGDRHKQTNKLCGLSPRANYTDRATAACRWSDCQLLRIKGATWSAWRIPMAVFSVF